MSPESTAPSGQALPAGTRLEEFEVERVLETGGFGITYLARDTSLGRKVVIKENLPSAFAFRDTASGTVRSRSDLTEDEDNFRWSMKNFLREADTLASLDHPGIVSVLRKFEANGTAYFVMPFMEGLPLDELMKNRRDRGEEISDDELRGLLEHVLDALGYLHGKSIYHRDIKPGNILVTKEGVPILIDFGSARQRLSERSMTVVESAGYTPFEQLQSRGNVGSWSDLYSLGATVAKAISGEAPPKAMDRMRDDPYEPLRQNLDLRDRYSSVLLDSIDRALEVNEAARWQEAGQWQRALMVAEEPIPPAALVEVAPPPSSVVPPPPVAPAAPPLPPNFVDRGIASQDSQVGQGNSPAFRVPPAMPVAAQSPGLRTHKQTPAYTDLSQVPWYRKSGSNSAMIWASLLTCGLFPGTLVVCVLVLTGDIYMSRTDASGYLKTWSRANKIAAIILLGLQGLYILAAMGGGLS